MPVTKVEADRPAQDTMPALNELDRVKLTKAVVDRDQALGAGLRGTVVLCHGSDAYEVEFDGIDDFFKF